MSHTKGITKGEGIITLLGTIGGGYFEYRRQAEEIRRGDRREVNPFLVAGGAAAGGALTYSLTKLSPGQIANGLSLLATAANLANPEEGKQPLSTLLNNVSKPVKEVSNSFRRIPKRGQLSL